MALMSYSLPCFTFTSIKHDSLPFVKHSFCFGGSQRFKLFPLCSVLPSLRPLTSSCCSSHSNILHSVEEEEGGEGEQTYPEEGNEEGEVENEQIEDIPDDPVYRFLKSRSSTKDPGRESKLIVRKDRRVVWHLADDLGSSKDDEPDVKIETRGEEMEEKDELGCYEKNKVEGIVGKIMEIARNLPKNSTLGEHLGGYEGRVGKRECEQVLELMCEEGLMMSCLLFYDWMRLQQPSLVTPRACSMLFPALGKNRMGDKLMILWRNLPKSKEFLDIHVHNAAISGLMACGRYTDAWTVYEAMEMNNIMPDRVTGSVMITIMRKQGRSAKDAWEFFQRLNRKGVEWSLEIIGALIKSFCDEGLLKQALIIQIEMEKKGVSPNTIIYNTLMDAYCKSNQLEEAEALFIEMKSKGLSPSSATYNILIDAYSKRMQPEIVEKFLEELQSIGLEPDVKTYTSLISAYGKQKMSDMAADAFLRMKKAGIKPTSHSYTALIHAYSLSGWHEKAYKSFENMQREGTKPSIETYTALLDAFRRAGDAQRLMEIWKSMILEKVEGTQVTFNIILDGLAKQGLFVEARDVVCEFGKLGFQPTVLTYNMLMNAYARGGQHLKLPQLLQQMEARNLKPDSVTYSTMIYAFVRVRDFRRAFFYHKQMVKSGQVPDHKSYEKLRSILDVKAAVKNNRDKHAILGIVNSKMGVVKVKKKGKKDELWKNKNRLQRSHGSAEGR